ncbi:MAG: helix-turn-helix transcriptional regulator [Saprospiraceae bacterium]|nr:helix-turn-helix transcriptional regulator [Saprospiraceae bacterium]
MMNKKPTVQQSIIDEVKKNYTDNSLFMSNLCRLLNISQSGLYSKLNGRTTFNFEELVKICRRYKISMDYFIYENDPDEIPYSFHSDAIRKNPDDNKNYLTNIHDHLSRMIEFENIHCTYLANDIPLFYYIQFPKLLAFKMFVWDITNWNLHKTTAKFNIDNYLKDNQLWKIADHINEIYQKYPSAEIWNYNMLNTTIQQIWYFLDQSNFEKPNQALELIKSLRKMIEHFRKQLLLKNKISFGRVEENAPVEIYLNEIILNGEMITISSNSFEAVYLIYDTPNYIRSYDPRICNHSIKYIEQVIDFALPINNTGRRFRTQLIEHYKHDVDKLEKKINTVL